MQNPLIVGLVAGFVSSLVVGGIILLTLISAGVQMAGRF